MDPEILKKIIQILRDEDKDAAIKLLEEMAVGAPADDGAPADPTAASSDPPDPEKEAMSALSRDVCAKLNAKNAGEAAARFAEILSAHAETEKRSRDLEASERRGLVADLVKIGAETPATAWQKNAEGETGEGDARQPVKRLADEPIAELRSRVKALAAARPAPRSRDEILPVEGDESKLNEYDRAKAAEISDPKKRARFVALRLAKGNS